MSSAPIHKEWGHEDKEELESKKIVMVKGRVVEHDNRAAL